MSELTIAPQAVPENATPHASHGATTLGQAFQQVLASRPDATALRTVGGATTITFSELNDSVMQHARGLHALGLRRGDTIALMMSNRVEFYPIDIAAQHIGVTAFSIYNTLPLAEINHVLDNSRADAVFCEAQYVQRILDSGVAPQHIVVVDADPANAPAGSTALTAFLEDGSADFDVLAAAREVSTDDVATMIYTSGTTGPSKGVEATHAALLAESRAVADVLGVRDGDRITSFMPSAHIADRLTALYWLVIFGLEVTVVAEPSQIAAAIPDCRPTIWGAVPRVWEKLKAAVEVSIDREPDEQKKGAMNWAFDVAARRVALLRAGETVPAELEEEFVKADAMVLSAVREKLGFGETRWAMSGAAPISADTLAFFTGLGLKISEIWGQSECTCIATCGFGGPTKLGTVGQAIPGVDLALADDGEVLLRGDILMKQYRGEPQKTADAFTEDGWLKTGDIGTIDEDGFVKIIDRKKELIINASGKNMSPVKIEKTIGSKSNLIGEVVAQGDGRPYNVGLVALDAEVMASVAAKLGVDYDAATLASHPEVRRQVSEAVAEGNAELARVEQIRRFYIVPSFWQPGGDELTLTMKIRRKPIAERYADAIDRMYDQPEHEDFLEPAASVSAAV